MKVIFIENLDPYIDSSGGIATYIKNLSEFLNRQKTSNVLIGASNTSDVNKKDFQIPVNDFINLIPKKIGHPKFIAILFLKIWNIKFTKDTIIHSQRPDVLVPIAILRKNQNLVCSLHGIHSIAVYHKRGKLQGFIYEILERIAFKKAQLFIAVDINTKKYYEEKYPYAKNKIVVIPIGINFKKTLPINKKDIRQKYGLNEEHNVLIYVGRLEKEKNLRFLIDVFINVKQKVNNAKLLLVGSGREEEKLKLYVRKKRVEDVIFLGPLSNKNTIEVINCADVFTFCSLYEGSPTIIKEALACNIPVVSVDVGDVKEVIKDIEYCTIVERDVSNFAKKVIDVLNRSHNYMNIRNSIKKYDNEHLFKKTLTLYKNLISNKFKIK